MQHIQQRSNNLLQVEEGSLYPALQRLLKARLVKAERISSFERMFEGITLVLNPGKSPAIKSNFQ